MGDLVLVTGGSGFIATWCIKECLAHGFRVRTTVRSLKRQADVRKALTETGASKLENLSFVEADLTKDAGWSEAVEGCSFVLHMASPFPPGIPNHEDDLIVPARQGSLRVLRAARDAGVKRVVLTSSMAAVSYGHKLDETHTITEKMWSNLDASGIDAYTKSKTLAERAAWEFIESEGGSLELATVNPVGVFGPVHGPDFATSIILVQRLMNGSMPGLPQLNYGVVDVRDVADLHLRAMLDPKAKGERFIAVSPPALTAQEMADALRQRLGHDARKVPKHVLPNFALKIISPFDAQIRLILPELGKPKALYSNEKARTLLGWDPRSPQDAIVATGQSLVKYNLV